MKKILNKVKDKIKSFGFNDDSGEEFDEYLEIDTNPKKPKKTAKLMVKPCVLEDFSDVKEILDEVRQGYTIALINIRPLKDKDLVELKRAVSKLRKTCDAIDGDIAGFGGDWVVVTPSFASVHRTNAMESFGDE